MSKQFWAVIIVVVLALVGVFIATGHKSSTTSSTGSTAQATNHVEGNTTSGVKLVEYGDYECPFCEEYAPIVAQVFQQYSAQMSFQFRNFPLTSIHPNAFASARAAEAAGLQGKFWQMHDALYTSSNWQQWSTASNPTPYFDAYATEIGLNATTFKADFASSKVNDLVTADMAAGTKLNVNATPTFYLNGKQIQVGATVADFQKVVAAAISGKVTSTGTTAQTTK